MTLGAGSPRRTLQLTLAAFWLMASLVKIDPASGRRDAGDGEPAR